MVKAKSTAPEHAIFIGTILYGTAGDVANVRPSITVKFSPAKLFTKILLVALSTATNRNCIRTVTNL